MGYLSDTLRDMGFKPTGEESPITEDGELWSKGIELVCDETATVIDGNHHTKNNKKDKRERYRNSGLVRLAGGFTYRYEYYD
jgi:hypothetical protein